MKLIWQTILGLVLVFALMSSLASADSWEKDESADDSLLGASESDNNADVQQDYLNVGDYVRPPPPWWF